MHIILLEKIPNLGELGDQVKVRAGYARNFLVPHKKAIYATADAKEIVEQRRQELAKLEGERIESAKARAHLAIKSVSLSRLVVDPEEGKLFGSVTNSDIAEAITAEGTEIKRAEVQLPDGPLKQTGSFDIEVILHPEVKFTVTVNIVGEEGEIPAEAVELLEDRPSNILKGAGKAGMD